MDIKGPFGKKPTKNANRYVLVVVDLLTRAAEMIPIPDKSAKTVASAPIRDVFCRRGIPESILTDRGCEFYNQTLSTIAQELGIVKKRISPLHPQANGIVERLNRTIGEVLRKTTDQCGEDWDLEIPALCTVQLHESRPQCHWLLALLPVLWLSFSHTTIGSCTTSHKAPAVSPSVGINSGLASQISTFWSCHS